MENVIRVNATTKCKYDLEVQKTCQIKMMYCYFWKKKKINIEVPKIALRKRNTTIAIGFTRKKNNSLQI